MDLTNSCDHPSSNGSLKPDGLTTPSSKSATATNLGHLPTEILHQIAANLPQADVCSLRLVSRACLRVDIRCMMRTLPFGTTVTGLAKLRAICSSPDLSHYVREFEMSSCAPQSHPSRSKESALDLIKDIETECHRVVIRYLLGNGSLAFPNPEKKARKAVTDALERLKQIKLSADEDKLPYSKSCDLIIECLHLLTPQFPRLQAVALTYADPNANGERRTNFYSWR